MTCPQGQQGCACGAGCGAGLVCASGVCVEDTCVAGALGCPCSATSPACETRAFCDGTLCHACTSDVAGCPCESGVCGGGLLCDGDACREPFTCADLRAAGSCGQHQRCQQTPGSDATCIARMCESGYRWVSATSTCVACTSADCSAEPTCEPGLPNSLSCGANRVCETTDGVGACGGCVPGYLLLDGACVPSSLCGTVTCDTDEYCDTTNPVGPTCTAWPCPSRNQVRATDGTCSVTCTRSCAIAGSTGNYWPYADVEDNCICETLDGWYFDNGGEIAPVRCDADDDGFVREEVRTLLDDTTPDRAILANARCTVRSVGAIELRDEYGISSLVESCEEGLLQERTSATCTPFPLRLFETKRNDVDGEAERLGEAPAYAAGGRRFRVDELNSLTKACVNALGDYDDDGFEDISQTQPTPTDTSALGESARIRAFAHFVELYTTSYEPPTIGETLGTLVIAERPRCDSSFPLGYGSDLAYAATDASTYWRSCQRRRNPAFDAETSAVGSDFGQWSCAARTGTCDVPAVPAHPTLAAFPSTDVALMRNHGLCELGGVPPADGVFRGMNHASQFQCVQVVADGNATRAWHRTQSDLRATGTAVFNACTVTSCTGVPGCTDSYAPSGDGTGVHDPVITCSPMPGSTIPEGSVGWAALRYRAYGHPTADPTDPSGARRVISGSTTYLGGCINEDYHYPSLCPAPEYGYCATAATDAFGRYRCYGWDGLALWADDDSATVAERSELEWVADSPATASNATAWNPTDAPSCM